MLFKKIQDPLTERIVFDTTESVSLHTKNNETEIDVCEELNKSNNEKPVVFKHEIVHYSPLFKRIEKPLTEKVIFETEPVIEISDSERKRMEFEHKIRHEINECINEELSISDDVKNASNRIIYENG